MTRCPYCGRRATLRAWLTYAVFRRRYTRFMKAATERDRPT